MSEHAYIGTKKCGCVVAAVVDNPDHAKDVAKDVAGFIRKGLSIERVSIEKARVRLNRCECGEEAATETARSGQMELEIGDA